MAPPFSLPLLAKRKFTVVYLVRSLGLMPEFVSHDWHVQPSCQRPNRGPPRRREFSPGKFAVGRLKPRPTRIRLSSKLYKHTCGVCSCQLPLPTEFPDDFHIGKGAVGGGEQESLPQNPTAGSSPGFSPIRNDMLFGWAL